MKRVLLIIAVLLTAVEIYAQTPAPITGSSFVCIGGSTPLSSTTAGGTWSSSSAAVASVGSSTGIVSGITLGSVTITYSTSTGFVTKAITVKPLPVVTPSSLAGCVNSTYTLGTSPLGGSWTSTNPAIATVNIVGMITAVSPGVTNIVYTAAGGCSTAAPMTVNPIPAPITGTNFTYTGLTTSLANITPGGTWTTGNPLIASVTPTTGVVTGITAGLVVISYSLPTTCAAVYKVEVDPLPARNNLITWYPFCGDTTDHSGAGNNLINSGPGRTPAVLTSDRFGNPGNAYMFNGTNTMLNYTAPFPNSSTTPDFTYSVWINPTVAQSSVIMYNGNIAGDGLGFVMNNGTMGVPGTQVGVYFGGSGNLFASQPLVPIGAWHNLRLTKNGPVYSFSVDNGSPVPFMEANVPAFSEVFALGLNYHSTLPGFGPIRGGFSGAIDDAVIIDRQLNPSEMIALYNFNPAGRPFSLGNDTTICSDMITLVPSTHTIGALYTWRRIVPGPAAVIDTTQLTLPILPVSGVPNTYSLTISRPFGCTVADTILVQKTLIAVYLGLDIDSCIGDTITLAASSSYPSANFLWSTGEVSPTIDVTEDGTYYVTVDSVSSAGVCIGRDTVTVRFHVEPILSLPDIAHCDGSAATLSVTPDPSFTYLWSNGGTADNITVTSSGTYWVRVQNSGCTRTDTAQVLVVFDTVSFSMPDTAICVGATVRVGSRVTYNPIVTYQWTPTAGISTPNVPGADIRPDTSAWYVVTVSYPGCPDIVDSFHIDVQPTPFVFIGGNRHVCRGDTIHINASVKPAWYEHYIYSWAPATSLDCSTCSDVIFTPGDSVKLYLTVTTPAWFTGLAQGCMGLDSAWVFVHQNDFDTITRYHELCPGDSVQLIPVDTSTQGTINAAFQWTPSMYLDDPTSGQPWSHPITSIKYTLIAFSQFGCTDTLKVDIKVHPDAVINLGDSVTIYPGESYHISPQTNCSYFQWFPPLGLDNEFISDPTATPTVNTMYHVIGTTEAGCVTKDSIKIRIDPNSLLAIPNAFSPGSPYNNTFLPIARGMVSLEYFRIFDRWGVMVFETKNLSQGWDGMFNGKPQPLGVYVYEIEMVAMNGRKLKRQGNVTLIR